MNSIGNINLTPVSPQLTPQTPGGVGKPDGSFKNLLVESIQQVNTMQHDADKLVETLVTGGDVNPAEVLTAVQKADLSFRMMMQVRNKAMQAFDEIRNIRI